MRHPVATAFLALCTALAFVYGLEGQSDNFRGYTGASVSAPAAQWEAVTPSNSTNFTYFPRGIYVGVSGDVVAVDMDSNAVTFKAVPAGAVLPIRPKRINSTGTTATDLVAIR